MKTHTYVTVFPSVPIGTGALVPIDLICTGRLVLTGGRDAFIDVCKGITICGNSSLVSYYKKNNICILYYILVHFTIFNA